MEEEEKKWKEKLQQAEEALNRVRLRAGHLDTDNSGPLLMGLLFYRLVYGCLSDGVHSVLFLCID